MKDSTYIRLVIAGSRDFEDYRLLERVMHEIRLKYDVVEIISGGARGADRLGERYALEHDINLTVVKAEWNLYGKRAGYIRNEKMAKITDAVLVFWNGESRGSKHMIELTKKYRKKLRVVEYK